MGKSATNLTSSRAFFSAGASQSGPFVSISCSINWGVSEATSTL